jgi:hypothetical protein
MMLVIISNQDANGFLEGEQMAISTTPEETNPT